MATRSGVRAASALDALPTGLPPRRHVLDLDDYSLSEIEVVMQTTDAMQEVLQRSIRKVPALQGKTVVTLFYEPSTRTRVSFEQAGKVLSADVINLAISSSSVEKGESLLNTARTLEATRADVIIIRHAHSGAPHLLARCIEGSVVNAGDGAHAHPTQALLDLFTLRRRLGSVEGAKVAIVGDVLHSRVARSNLWGLASAGARVVLCGPPTLLPIDWLLSQHLQGRLASVTVTTCDRRGPRRGGRRHGPPAPKGAPAGRPHPQPSRVRPFVSDRRQPAPPGQTRSPGDAPRPHE